VIAIVISTHLFLILPNFFFFLESGDHLALHSFPTRRSSDLKVDFRVNLDAALPKLMVTDIKRLQQIIKNLLSNAFKFTHVGNVRSEEHTSELQSLAYLVCRLLLEKKKNLEQSQLITLRRITA